MPPKASRKGKGKKSEAANEGGGSSFHLDTRPVEAVAPKHDAGKEIKRLDTEVIKSKVGVAWINMLAMGERLKFGVYNDRPENDAETHKLILSFKRHGIVSMREMNAIPLIIEIDRVNNAETLPFDFSSPQNVPELELVDMNPIIVASGQHRLAALRQYHQTLTDEYRTLEKKRVKIKELKNLSEEHIRTFNEMREEMGTIKGILPMILQVH
ncbi:uncharacterized protein EDB93DRAFT_1259236 [Suillus bovinus]|uniref:uncharacterized protein n=1 Tax=Suillus bovinus TaxID=48563 RepID=UPI001B87EE39|nr:uncharacterized protein EDB93DRAFT_1259236 [Suillus bovinus]KAG2122756.1 hypothetical protein EDB93DRAFT_1259236 [Suillus bovinus]